MISKALIKDIKSLHQPKFRQIYNKFIAEGEKSCSEFLNHPKYKVDKIFIYNKAETKYKNLLKNEIAEVINVSQKEMFPNDEKSEGTAKILRPSSLLKTINLLW